ncbi:site-specific integrase [Solwaraspora sp. WMMA2080]|uniref:tyrosine-type recombinase/integrase n=1 Tax=unclassified Solwaraspora TaxID=2627926 RepID=UPI00248ACE2A|nr:MULTISPECIES: site-specific integrase [unclassified Solwaraspora]WBB97286.1 site-specific integrase [Solwaraspora sp. WMMA2059]WBC18812.1 site-specific integrase [Solwaraspora sp. WMMA2080]
MGRKPNGASSIYKGNDDYWHGRVTVGVKDNGRPDRRHVSAKTEAEVTRKVRALERERDSGIVRKPGQRWTVEKWLTHWVENIAAPVVRTNTLDGYRVAVRRHLIPGIGAHRLDRLEPEHLEKLYAKMIRSGSAPGTAHQAHRTIRTALGEAVRRGHLARNPAALAKPPRLPDTEIEPYSIAEVQAILRAADDRRNSARWAVALALGLRQGEALGLKWSDVDLKSGTLTVRRALLRPKWAHGCPGDCGKRTAGDCPQRVNTRPVAADTKSRAGRRSIGLPDALVQLLRKHRKAQKAERETAAQLWRDEGWVFANPTGGVINQATDYDEWKRLLKLAGVRDGRLHDARHTAATALLVLGVSGRAVMGIMGWSNSAMAVRYQHMTDRVRRDIAEQLGGLLWGKPEPSGEDDDDGTAGATVAA